MQLVILLVTARIIFLVTVYGDGGFVVWVLWGDPFFALLDITDVVGKTGCFYSFFFVIVRRSG